MKESSFANLGKITTVEFPCYYLISACSLSSVLFIAQAPSTKLKIPGGILANSKAFTMGLLSVKTINWVYSASPSSSKILHSFLKMYSMYKLCNLSLAKLMKNYSKEFLSKISKPKISKIPMVP
jgi:hypothetical protein